MSDILIKGMEIPDFLPDLTLPHAVTTYNCSIDVLPNGNAHLMFRGKSYSIIEIPTPHGRLIDADELIERIERFRDIHNYYPADIDATMRWFINQICGAKTIIGAELGKEANEVKKYRDYLASDTYAVCKRIENGEVSEK